MNYTNSPIEKINFNNQEYFVKRDDLLDSDFSGNKARKFYYYLINDFPNIKKVVSHGSSQSNAMYSLSVLCKIKNWQFDYYVDHTASFLKENPIGNYKYAIKNGTFNSIVKMNSYAFKAVNTKRVYRIHTSNKLLDKEKYVIGVKTGFTNQAGPCLIARAKKDKKDILVGQSAFGKLKTDRTNALKHFRKEKSNTFIFNSLLNFTLIVNIYLLIILFLCKYYFLRIFFIKSIFFILKCRTWRHF